MLRSLYQQPLTTQIQPALAKKVKAKPVLSMAVLAVTVLLTSCNSSKPVSQTLPPQSPSKPKPKVVATTSVLCNLTQEIAADTVDLTCLMPLGADPHIYQAKPEDAKAIASAQLILYNGYNFEHSTIKLIQSASEQIPKVAVAEIAVPQPLLTEAEQGHAEERKDNQKSESKVPDPHIWHNALNGIKMAETINKNLSKIVPEKAELYAQNTKQLSSKLYKVNSWIKTAIATIPPQKRKLITTHDALGYYANAYNIPLEGALSGISTEEQPTPTRIAELVKIIRSTEVPTIFAEVNVNPQLITAVAKEANVKISEREIFADGLGDKSSGAETYLGMLQTNTRTIVEGLGGQYTPLP